MEKNTQNLHAANQLNINITNSNHRQKEKWVNGVRFAGDVTKIRRHSLISGLLLMSDAHAKSHWFSIGFPSTVSPLACNYGVR